MDRLTMERLMVEVRAEAERSWREGGIPVGAVLAREDGTVVARGHNQRIQNDDPTSHGDPSACATPDVAATGRC